MTFSKSNKLDAASKYLTPSFQVTHVPHDCVHMGTVAVSSVVRTSPGVFHKIGDVVPGEQRVPEANKTTRKKQIAKARPALMDVFKKTVRCGSAAARHRYPAVCYGEEKPKDQEDSGMDFSPEPTIEDIALMFPRRRNVIIPKRRVKRRRKANPVLRPSTLMVPDYGLGVIMPKRVLIPTSMKAVQKPGAFVEVMKAVDLDVKDAGDMPRDGVETVVLSNTVEDGGWDIEHSHGPKDGISLMPVFGEDMNGKDGEVPNCISFIQDSLPHVAEVNYSSTETVLEMESLPRLNTGGYSSLANSSVDDDSILWPNIYPNVNSRWSVATEDMLVEEIQPPKFIESGTIPTMHEEIIDAFVNARNIFIEMNIGKVDWTPEESDLPLTFGKDVDNDFGSDSVGMDSQVIHIKESLLSCAGDSTPTTTTEDVFLFADSAPTTPVESFCSPSALSIYGQVESRFEGESLEHNAFQQVSHRIFSSEPLDQELLLSAPWTKYADESLTKVALKKARRVALFPGNRLGSSHLSAYKEDLKKVVASELAAVVEPGSTSGPVSSEERRGENDGEDQQSPEVEFHVGGFGLAPPPPPPPPAPTIPSVYSRTSGLRPMLLPTHINLRNTARSSLVIPRRPLSYASCRPGARIPILPIRHWRSESQDV